MSEAAMHYEPAPSPEDLSLSAVRTFTEASRLYPAAGAPQSAWVALRAQELGVSPVEMHAQITDDQVVLIAEMANKMHDHTKAVVPRVFPYEVRAVLFKVFSLAEEITLQMSPDEAQEVITRYEADRQAGDHLPNLKRRLGLVRDQWRKAA